MTTLFTYGTLKQGFGNHDRIFGGYDIKITPAWTYGKLYDLGYFPALTEGNNKVYGELIEFDNPAILKRVDYLEGYRGENSNYNFYERRDIQVFTDKNEVTAWAYFLNKSKIIEFDGELITSGVWSNYRY
ncbi:MAG: gamma-glutamylcyclotransferase [Candidatus Marinimicrobia bacterium]|nr:gamma-glutamylcyclotransferase [Candidatus Neomarinimicrobiota bacterium]